MDNTMLEIGQVIKGIRADLNNALNAQHHPPSDSAADDVLFRAIQAYVQDVDAGLGKAANKVVGGPTPPPPIREPSTASAFLVALTSIANHFRRGS